MYPKIQRIPPETIIDFMFHEYNKVISDELAFELSDLFTSVIRNFHQNNAMSKLKIRMSQDEENPWMVLIGGMGLVANFFHFQFQNLALIEKQPCVF